MKTKRGRKVLAVWMVLTLAFLSPLISTVGRNEASAAVDTAEAIDLATSFKKTFVLGISETVQTVVMPVSFSKDVYCRMTMTVVGAEDITFCSICKQAGISQNVSDYVDIVSTAYGDSITTTYNQSSFSGKGDLYLVLMKSKKDMDREVTITLDVQATPVTDGGTLKKGETTTSVSSGRKAQYYKMTLPGAGKVTVKTDASLDLCSSKKKELVEGVNGKEGTTLILDKGTYYLKIENTGITTFSYTYKKTTLSANRTKGKAKTMKLGKKVSGVFPVNSKGCWYKLKIDETKKVKTKYVLSKTLADSGISIIIYNKNKKKYESTSNASAKKGTFLFWAKNGKLKFAKGTYLIKVAPYSETGSGKFSLTIK